MADKLPFEEPLRRVLEANLRYYEALGQVTQEYWKAIFGIARELPIKMGRSGSAEPSSRSANPSTPTSAATLVLEAEAGSEAQGVFMVENRLARTVSTAAITSSFADPSGRALDPKLRVVPSIITLESGGRTLVQIIALVTDEFEPDVPYRGEVTVPGLSDQGIPVVLRRRASAPAREPAAPARSAGERTPKKRIRRKRRPSKRTPHTRE